MSDDRIRTTISLRPDVLEIFKRMAEASGGSASRCMGDWLENTSTAARILVRMMEQANEVPQELIDKMKLVFANIDKPTDLTDLH